MGRGCGHGHGKAILAGEHFVLDGATAVAIPLLAFRTEVRFEASKETPSVALAAGKSRELSTSDTEQAVAMLARALELAGASLGVKAAIESTVPLRRGFGSSAALAVAAVRAAWSHADRGEPPADLWLRQARDIEALVHGTSSGLDPAAAMGRGAVAFRDGQVRRTIDAQPTTAWCRARWVLVDLGPGPATSAVIHRASQARRRMPAAALGDLVARADSAARAAIAGLSAGDPRAVAEAMMEAGACLERIDVVDERMRTCIAATVEAGALATKQTGAGLGGALLALAPDAETADTVCHRMAALAATTWIVETFP